MAVGHRTTEILEELVNRSYRKVIRGNRKDGFLAEVPDLPGCAASGESEADALESLQNAMKAWFESALENNEPIPQPEQSAAHGYKGRILLRVPPALHHRLAAQSQQQDVPMNQWLTTLLSWGSGFFAHGTPPRSGWGGPSVESVTPSEPHPTGRRSSSLGAYPSAPELTGHTPQEMTRYWSGDVTGEANRYKHHKRAPVSNNKCETDSPYLEITDIAGEKIPFYIESYDYWSSK